MGIPARSSIHLFKITFHQFIFNKLYRFNMKLQIIKSPQPPLIRGAKSNNMYVHIEMLLVYFGEINSKYL